MTTGQPIKFPSDRNKYNNEYMESLKLQINLNQNNLEVNRLYKETGQLPASTQMMDTRSNEEKLADVHNLKQSIISDLAPIAEPMFASAVIQGVIDSPLNVNNSLFRYLAQNAQIFAQSLSKKYKFGIAGDANDVTIMVQFLEDAYNKTQNSFQSIKGYINSNTNEGNKTRSNVLSANDTDNIILELKDIIKRFAVLPALPASSVEHLIELETLIIDLIEFLPSSDQMKIIIDNMVNFHRDSGNPNTWDPEWGELMENGIAYEALKILQTLPKLSSIQTLTDRLNRAINQQDTRNINQCCDAMLNLFATFNTVENRLLLTRFRREFIDRANRELSNYRHINEVNTIDNIRQTHQLERNQQRAQKVYIVNPANDPANVVNHLFGGAPPAPQQNPPEQAQAEEELPVQPQAPGFFDQLGQMLNPFYEEPAVPLISRNDYITHRMNFLTDDGLRNLIQAMARSQLFTEAESRDLAGGLRDETRVQKKRYITRLLTALPENVYNPSVNPPLNFFNVGGPAGISGLGLKPKKVKKGRGLYSPFGDSEINHKNLENNILTLRRKSKTNYMDLPSKHISKHMKNIIHNIVGGKIANFEDINNLNDEERNYLNKVISKSNLQDRLSVPAPSKDQADKDNHQWEVMRGEIMAGNDSHELVKKFKILTMKLTRQGLLPKNEVMELFEDLVNLGY
jgi:hypothetical protein